MKYDPLRIHLSNLPASSREATLKFDEIEKILDARLPRSASTYGAWWANQLHGSQSASWQGAGFVVDSVDFGRKLVRFRRGENGAVRDSSKKRDRAISPSAPTPAPVSEEVLKRAGFVLIAEWKLVEGNLRLEGEIPDNPSVYAHVVEGIVMYVGMASKSLRQRMYFYVKPGKTQSTNLRMTPLINGQLAAGKRVWLLAAQPGVGEWNGLSIDLVAGLEAGLLKTLRPPWNLR